MSIEVIESKINKICRRSKERSARKNKNIRIAVYFAKLTFTKIAKLAKQTWTKAVLHGEELCEFIIISEINAIVADWSEKKVQECIKIDIPAGERTREVKIIDLLAKLEFN